jgi:phospholipid/cholesterol/gamma-HCH transport system substrate-binding protein
MNYKALIRFVIFLAVAGLFAVMEMTTLTGPHTGTTDTYRAIFATPDGVSGLREGNPVRVAGVAVGKVSDIELVNATEAKVTFTANRNQKITTHTWAIVRYANLLGQRYLGLSQPQRGGTVLAAGATIPKQRTQPALSLTDLFNGFRPLFSSLTPQQVNELSQDIIDVLQGQSARIDDLITRTADLTGNLADRDTTFSEVVDSLSTLLTTVSKHDDQLANTVTTLHALTAELHTEGPSIVGSLNAVDNLIGSVGGLFDKLEDHNLPGDIADAASLTKLLASNTDTFGQLLTGFASAFQTFSRVTQNGNWLNIYACNVQVQTYGTVTVTLNQLVGGLDDFLSGLLPGVGGTLTGILSGLGLIGGNSLLSNLPGLQVPLQLPNGTVGASTQHTAVCS